MTKDENDLLDTVRDLIAENHRLNDAVDYAIGMARFGDVASLTVLLRLCERGADEEVSK